VPLPDDKQPLSRHPRDPLPLGQIGVGVPSEEVRAAPVEPLVRLAETVFIRPSTVTALTSDGVRIADDVDGREAWTRISYAGQHLVITKHIPPDDSRDAGTIMAAELRRLAALLGIPVVEPGEPFKPEDYIIRSEPRAPEPQVEPRSPGEVESMLIKGIKHGVEPTEDDSWASFSAKVEPREPCAHQVLVRSGSAAAWVWECRDCGAVQRAPTSPVPMVLHCPECSARHIDEGEFATKPHHTHSCQSCGLTWRPAVVHTVGVGFLPGFKNDFAFKEKLGGDGPVIMMTPDGMYSGGRPFGAEPPATMVAQTYPLTVEPRDLRATSASIDDTLRGFLARARGIEHQAAREAWGEWSTARLHRGGGEKEAFHAGWDAAFAFAAKLDPGPQPPPEGPAGFTCECCEDFAAVIKRIDEKGAPLFLCDPCHDTHRDAMRRQEAARRQGGAS
jgi:hypothetical protein